MLINDLECFTRRANYSSKTSGLDTPGESISSSRDFREYPIQDFTYQFNSWGFRGPEYVEHIGKPVNICLGDSFTVNVGGPIDHSWPSQLAEHFNISTLNLGMDGAGNDAIHLVYTRACKLFDVQDTFVMYSYLHRRLVDNEFTQEVHNDSENFRYFLKHRIPNVYECALPAWTWNKKEQEFLLKQYLYFLNEPLYFSDYQDMDRKLIDKESYENLRGTDWPTLTQFLRGDDPHPDMLTKDFGKFIYCHPRTNRDGYHMNQNANKIYANYLYNQWEK